jgi:heme oxygenase
MDSPISTVSSTRLEFVKTLEKALAEFQQCAFLKRIDEKRVTLANYHTLLHLLFHQVETSSSTFALAGANCDLRRAVARDYFIKHAEEERTHWTWILNDLKNTKYAGPDPRDFFPHEATQAYISFNFYVASRMPLARLGIAVMLEGLGAQYGQKYARKVCEILQLKESQATFFFGHGETDKMHTKQIWQVIDQCELSGEEWAYLRFAASTAFKMYRRMYDEALG